MRVKKVIRGFTLTIVIYWAIIKDYVKPFLNWRFLVSFFTAWMITNGWSYIFVAVGGFLNIKWMLNVGLWYQAFLWLPITPEKLVTFPIAMGLHRLLFPKDFKNLNMFKKLINAEKKKV